MGLKLYLAGPDVFLPNASEIGLRKQEICRTYGFEGLFPLNGDATVRGEALEIFHANCALMRQADAGVFNLTPFRSPSADAGTVFELGSMFCSQKPLYGYTSDPRDYRERVEAAFELTEQGSRPRDRNAYAIENFGWRDNLMIIGAIQEAGGTVAAVAEPDGETGTPSLSALAAFEACLRAIHNSVDRNRGEFPQP
jgi:nucleoside 2-deoxyribosyltransferase